MAEEGKLIGKISHYFNNIGVAVVELTDSLKAGEKMADFAARLMAENGIRNIKIYDVSKTHISYIISDIWRYKSLVLGSCAYNTGMHPMMVHLCHELEVVNPKDKNYALFGSYSWSGGGLKSLLSFAEKMNWNLVSDPIDLIGSPNVAKMEGFQNIANKIL